MKKQTKSESFQTNKGKQRQTKKEKGELDRREVALDRNRRGHNFTVPLFLNPPHSLFFLSLPSIQKNKIFVPIPVGTLSAVDSGAEHGLFAFQRGPVQTPVTSGKVTYHFAILKFIFSRTLTTLRLPKTRRFYFSN